MVADALSLQVCDPFDEADPERSSQRNLHQTAGGGEREERQLRARGQWRHRHLCKGNLVCLSGWRMNVAAVSGRSRFMFRGQAVTGMCMDFSIWRYKKAESGHTEHGIWSILIWESWQKSLISDVYDQFLVTLSCVDWPWSYLKLCLCCRDRDQHWVT